MLAGSPSRSLRDCFEASPYHSVKHSTYFPIYESLFAPFRGRAVTFVEIGVLGGGSLFMWRDWLGPEARIVGIDVNPQAARLREQGFEIFIGDQADPEFWSRVLAEIGPVDVVLDDGGHTNRQQIVTATSCIPHIRDGGLLVTEDVHSSYLTSFGNPSRYSYAAFAKALADDIAARFPGLPRRRAPFNDCVHSVRFFTSIVCLEIDRRLCDIPRWAGNAMSGTQPDDLRTASGPAGAVAAALNRSLQNGLLARLPLVGRRSKAIMMWLEFMLQRADSRRLKSYFRR